MKPEVLIIFSLLVTLIGRENIRRGDAVFSDFCGVLLAISGLAVLIARDFS